MTSNKQTGLVQSYLTLLKGKWGQLFGIFIVYLIKHSPALALPIVTAVMIDLAVQTQDPRRFSKLLFYFILMMVLVLQNIPSHILYARMLSSVMRGISQQLRQDLCRQLQRLSLLYHHRSNIGKLHSKVIRDIEIIEQTPRIFSEQIFSFICQVAVAVGVIAMRKPQALWFFLVGVPIVVVLRNRFIEPVTRSAKNYRQSFETMTSSLNDMLNMIPITRAHGLEEFHVREVDSKIIDVFTRGKNFDTIAAIFGSTAWVAMTAVHVIFIAGSVYACMKGLISVGDIVLFNSMFLVLTGQMIMILNTLPQLSQAKESIVSVREVLDSPDLEENSGKNPFETIEGRFDFRSVHYRYPDTTQHALVNFSLEVPPGQSIAFVGPSGSGKSTVLSMVLGFIRPNSGTLHIDGMDVMEMDLRTYRKHVGVVTQDSIFFSGTVFDNVTYGQEDDIQEQDILDALKAADAYDFIQALPDGLYTHMGSDGLKFSGGQMQRLAIARAIVRNPKVLILDEATSSLDTESEKKIQIAMDRLMKNRTTFVVAHRISTIQNVDRIVILDKGKIVDQGTPAQLVKGNNLYSRAIQHPFQKPQTPDSGIS
jgi:ATP-binding cassette subfamily B protein